CGAFDRGGDGAVTIDELIAAIGAVLNGCPRSAFAGEYTAAVTFDASHSGMLALTADANGQITGSLVAAGTHSSAHFISFPFGGVSVTLTGSYDSSGGFEVEGSFVGNDGQPVPVVVSGTLPGQALTALVNIYLANDPPISATLSAALLPTPTSAPGPT